MDLYRALRTAHAVDRAGTLTAAARMLGVTPAAVTKTIGQLEARLGLRLFDRNTHHLAVSAEGRAFLDRTAAPLVQIDDAVVGAAARLARGGETGGTVKVSVPAPFARMAVLPGLAAFHAAHPAVRLDLRLENRRVDLTGEGYDCAIGADLAPDANLVARPLASLRPVLCASPGYVAAQGMPASVADLRGHRCIVLRSESTGRLREWDLCLRGRTQRLLPDAVVQVTDPETAAAAAAAGCGIALVGAHHVAALLAGGGLVRVLPDVCGPRFQIAIYFAQRRLLPPRTRVFVDHVVASVPQAPALLACRDITSPAPARQRKAAALQAG